MSEEPTPDEIAAAGFGIHEQAVTLHSSTSNEGPKSKPARKKPASDLHREFPQSPDSERGVLSAILLAPEEVLDLCAEKKVTRETFYLSAHQELYQAMVELRALNRPVEFIGLAQYLRDRGLLDAIGGPALLNELSVLLPSAAYVSHHIDDLLTKAMLRKGLKVASEFEKGVYDSLDETTAFQLVDDFERDVLAIRRENEREKDLEMQAIVGEAVKVINWRLQNPGQISGLPTGFAGLDKATDGFHAEEFIILASRPSEGKTSLARQMAEHLAMQGEKVAFYGLEMSNRQLVEAWIMQMAKVNHVELRQRPARQDEEFRILEAAATLAKLPIIIKDGDKLTIQAFRASARRLVNKRKVKAIFVDSASAMTSDSGKRDSRRQDDVADITSGFKAAAKELKVPIIVLWHLGRQADGKEGDPTLADLRGGATAEQDADTVAMLCPKVDEAGGAYTEVFFPKNRMGERFARVPLIFERKWTRFVEPSVPAEQTEMSI